mmetsp:Transcript_20454/g.28771  ORF Transcript_20454/g.28771 Transcript_20454/m.28771 type:complete len:98 (+) Transcript_20454:799-1092(+)
MSITKAKQKFELAKVMQKISNRMCLPQTNDIAKVTNEEVLDFIEKYPPISFKAKSATLKLDNPSLPPGPHSHKFMTPSDKEVWNASYLLEYTGLPWQ